jgi:hypothetical protein
MTGLYSWSELAARNKRTVDAARRARLAFFVLRRRIK